MNFQSVPESGSGKWLSGVFAVLVLVMVANLITAEPTRGDTLSDSEVTLTPILTGGPTCVQQAASSSSCSGTFTNAVISDFGQTTGFAKYGELGSSASASQSLLEGTEIPPGYDADARTEAQFNDSLTFSDVTPGDFLAVTTTLTGGITSDDPNTTGFFAQGFLQTDLTDFSNPAEHVGECDQYNTDVSHVCTTEIAISATDTVGITSSLFSIANISGFGDITANFFNTGEVTSLVVLNSDGQIDPNAQIITASGTTYPVSAATAPEPCSFTLLGTALLWVAMKRATSSRGKH